MQASEGSALLTEVRVLPVVAVINLHVDVVRPDARQQVPGVRPLSVCPHRIPPYLQLVLGLAPFDRPLLHGLHKCQPVPAAVTGYIAWSGRSSGNKSIQEVQAVSVLLNSTVTMNDEVLMHRVEEF